MTLLMHFHNFLVSVPIHSWGVRLEREPEPVSDIFRNLALIFGKDPVKTPFDILHNENTSTRRRSRNRTYDMPSIQSMSRRETVASGNNRDNGNNANDVDGDSGRCGSLPRTDIIIRDSFSTKPRRIFYSTFKMFRGLTKKFQEQFRLPKFPKEPIEENSLPFNIGSNVSIKNYNKYLENRELSGYKLEYNNGNVFIIDMCTQEHEDVVAPNSNEIADPPIIVSGQPLHPSPNADGLRIAPDIAVRPNKTYVPRPPNPGPLNIGPPPSDTRGNPHARIVCEVAVSQSYRGLKNKCELWMSQQYVRCVLGIKLYDLRTTRNTHGQYNRSMKAKLWRQGMPTRKVMLNCLEILFILFFSIFIICFFLKK
ncbi:hypothetical protein F8M41_024398 [Gigaspora margarita]|uniref:Uncharacterized protein n=1 Tax=Gigaspora margarita TaxID=4874 RepID=A0A8H4ABJ3_GIGMA|nr:hypothetical protein F8M41_024398 [Gigaspora margarita]